MLSVWTLFATTVFAASVSAISRRIIIHGSQLTLDLPERTQRLKFVSADESDKFTIWEHKSSSLSPSKPSKGQVSSASNGWTFRIQHVTFDDQGTYTLLNQSGSTIASYILKVNVSKQVTGCIAGETLTISLAGLKQSDATLRFYSNYSSITLVENGVPVGRNHTDYINRLKVTSESIKVLNVSASDKGRYKLTDHKGRLVSHKAMILVASVSAISRRIIIHGSQLTLDLPERTQRLKFVSADESDKFTIWEHKSSSLSPSKPSKGQVSSARNGWTFRIQHVTFDDQGTYTLLNQSGSTIASYILKVNVSKQVTGCIAGETLTISLAGLKQSDATLRFYSNYSSITLVENGVPVGRNHTDYINRLKVTSESIKVLNVSASDKGKYRLTDHKGRLVSLKAMILVDQHKFAPNKRLIALLLLVIPVGICFCCRKRICKSCQTTKSNTHTNESNTTPVSIAYSNTVTAPVGPGDPGQGYIAGYPPHPDQGQIHYPYPPESSGQPYVPHNPGFHPESVPQNPVYPPNFGPGLPPAQPPQWNAPPTQYNPSAPVNYMPAKNSAPPGPDTTGLNMNELPPTAPLLTPQMESQPSAMSSISMMNMLKSSDSGVQFDNNKGKSSGSNFL